MSDQDTLLEAIYEGDLPRIKMAVIHGAQLNYVYRNASLTDVNFKNVTPLVAAIGNYKQTIALWMLENGAEFRESFMLDDANYQTNTLVEAARYGMPDVIRWLLEHEIHPDAKTSSGETALTAALNADSINTFSALLDGGASPNSPNPPNSPIFEMTYGSVDELIKNYWNPLVNAGADVTLYKTNRADDKLKEKCEKQIAKIHAKLSCLPGAGAPRFTLVEDGRPTKDPLHILGAGELPELFSNHRWQGKEKQGIECYESIKDVLPEYFKIAHPLDLSALREQSLHHLEETSAVKRYVRPRGPESRQP